MAHSFDRWENQNKIGAKRINREFLSQFHKKNKDQQA